jgi:hypothetical protein
MAHPAGAPEDGLDRRVQRLDDAEANGMIAVRGDAIKVVDQGVTKFFHFGQPLPAQRLQPPEEKACQTVMGPIGPEAIELLAQNVRLEQPPIDGKQLLQLVARDPRTVSSYTRTPVRAVSPSCSECGCASNEPPLGTATTRAPVGDRPLGAMANVEG